MTTELLYLLLTAILTGVLWIPVVIGYVSSRGPLTPSAYEVAPTSSLPNWVNRANRAHLNAVENFAPFAVVVLIARAAGVSSAITVNCAAIYFFARVAQGDSHQRLRPVYGANRGVYPSLGCVYYVRGGSAAARDMTNG